MNIFPNFSGSLRPLKLRLAFALLAAAISLIGCISPYHIEVVQGNFVSREQLQALSPGMTRNQVRDILGTPLITSPFHADRWDYAFTIRRQGAAPQQRKLSVFFTVDQFQRVEADELPSEAEFAAKIDTQKINTSKPPKMEATEKELNAFKIKPSTPPSSPSEGVPASMNYPPLEPSSRREKSYKK